MSPRGTQHDQHKRGSLCAPRRRWRRRRDGAWPASRSGWQRRPTPPSTISGSARRRRGQLRRRATSTSTTQTRRHDRSTLRLRHGQRQRSTSHLEDGAYKLEFSGFDSRLQSEYYRDKADLATADVITGRGRGARPCRRGPSTTVPTSSARSPRPTGRPVDGRQRAGVRRRDRQPRAGERLHRRRRAPSASARPAGRSSCASAATTRDRRQSGDRVLHRQGHPRGRRRGRPDVGRRQRRHRRPGSRRLHLRSGHQRRRRRRSTASRSCSRRSAAATAPTPTAPTPSRASTTGAHVVQFSDPIGEYARRVLQQRAATTAARPPPRRRHRRPRPGRRRHRRRPAPQLHAVAPAGVDLSGTVRDELGSVGVGYDVLAYNTPADARTTVRSSLGRSTNRAGAYALHRARPRRRRDPVQDRGRRRRRPREEGDFARRGTWSGAARYGYETASAITAPRRRSSTSPCRSPVASPARSPPRPAARRSSGYVALHRRRQATSSGDADGHRGRRHVRRPRTCGRATTPSHVRRRPARPRVVEQRRRPRRPPRSRSSPARSSPASPPSSTKDVKARRAPDDQGRRAGSARPSRLDKPARWNPDGRHDVHATSGWSAARSSATGPTLKLTKKNLGDKVTGRVTNDAGFAQGQAVTKATYKVGYQPKVKAKVTKKSAAITLKVKPLKAKKVKATVTVFEIVGTKKNGDDKLQEARQGQDQEGHRQGHLQEGARQGQAQARLHREGQGQGRLRRHREEDQAQGLTTCSTCTTAPPREAPGSVPGPRSISGWAGRAGTNPSRTVVGRM